MKVFDVATAVIEAKQEELADTHVLSEEFLKIFEGYCRVLDDFVSDGWGNAISVDIAGSGNLTQVELSVMDFTYQPQIRSENYFDILKRALLFEVTNADGEYLKVRFTFPSLFVAK